MIVRTCLTSAQLERDTLRTGTRESARASGTGSVPKSKNRAQLCTALLQRTHMTTEKEGPNVVGGSAT